VVRSAVTCTEVDIDLVTKRQQSFQLERQRTICSIFGMLRYGRTALGNKEISKRIRIEMYDILRKDWIYFSQLASASISYFTVIYSTQQ